MDCYKYSMEKSEDQQIRLEICQKCFEHNSYDTHSEQQYKQAFQSLQSLLSQPSLHLTLIRNKAPQYLHKLTTSSPQSTMPCTISAPAVTSSKRHLDTNTNKIVQFPSKGAFQLHYRNVLVFSKLLTGVFPDFQYLAMLISELVAITRKSPLILDKLEPFRDIQYEWKKNTRITQSLYTFIKISACGNTTQQYIRSVLSQLIGNPSPFQKQPLLTQKNKNKVIHPYSIYDEKQKKFKMQSIYCPNSKNPSTSDMLTQRINVFVNRNFIKSALPKRPATGSVTCRQPSPGRPSSTANSLRKAGSIVPNSPQNYPYSYNYQYQNQNRDKRNHLFELVIKEENKIVDQAKLKRLIKGQNFDICEEDQYVANPNNTNGQIKHNNNFAHYTHQGFSTSQNNSISAKKFKRNYSNLKISEDQVANNMKTVKKKQQKNNKQVKLIKKQIYFAHLDYLKNRLKDPVPTPTKNSNSNSNNIANKLKLTFGKDDKNNRNSKQSKKSINNTHRSNNNSIINNNNMENKGVIDNLSSSRFGCGSIRKNLANDNENQNHFNFEGKNENTEEGDQKVKQQEVSDQSLYSQKSLDQQIVLGDNSPQSVRTNKRNYRCIKQSKYSKLRKSVEHPLQSFHGQLGFQAEANQTGQSSRLRRTQIQQKTVQKRISQLKRSSNHQRYPNMALSRYNSLQRQIDQSQVRKDGIINYEESEKQQENKIDEDNFCKIWDIQKEKWENYYVRERAIVVKKFSQDENFIHANNYSSRFEQIIKQQNCEQAQFDIKGEQLCNKFIIKSIRQLYKPSQLRLFPQIFKQIELYPQSGTQSGATNSNSNPNSNPNATNSSFTYQSPSSVSSYFPTKLIHVVNLMLRSNPMMITRIFEDKKYVNPYGVYCIWLRNLFGQFQPIFINDSFPFQIPIPSQDCKNPSRMCPIYSPLSTENSLWYMLLQKSIAKLVGGYHALTQLSLSQLMSIVMGSPTVDVGYVAPDRANKIFDQKIFYNKMASLYTFRDCGNAGMGMTNQKDIGASRFVSGYGNGIGNRGVIAGQRIDRIIGFNYNKRDNKQSVVNIKIEQSTISLPLRQFLLNYTQCCLLFFNNNYFLNQSGLPSSPCPHILSCTLTSTHSKNTVYLLFSQFPQHHPTRVTLYRRLSDQEANIRDGMNPLAEEDKRYEYVGELSKIGNFFIEVVIGGGQFVCVMQVGGTNGADRENGDDQCSNINSGKGKPFLSTFSQYPIQISEIGINKLQMKQKKLKKSHSKSSKLNKSSVSNSQFMEQNSQFNNGDTSYLSPTPKVLIEHRIPLKNNRFMEQKILKKKQKKQTDQNKQNHSQSRSTTPQPMYTKLPKKYLNQLDNIDQHDQQPDCHLSPSAYNSGSSPSPSPALKTKTRQPKKCTILSIDPNKNNSLSQIKEVSCNFIQAETMLTLQNQKQLTNNQNDKDKENGNGKARMRPVIVDY